MTQKETSPLEAARKRIQDRVANKAVSTSKSLSQKDQEQEEAARLEQRRKALYQKKDWEENCPADVRDLVQSIRAEIESREGIELCITHVIRPIRSVGIEFTGKKTVPGEEKTVPVFGPHGSIKEKSPDTEYGYAFSLTYNILAGRIDWSMGNPEGKVVEDASQVGRRTGEQPVFQWKQDSRYEGKSQYDRPGTFNVLAETLVTHLDAGHYRYRVPVKQTVMFGN